MAFSLKEDIHELRSLLIDIEDAEILLKFMTNNTLIYTNIANTHWYKLHEQDSVFVFKDRTRIQLIRKRIITEFLYNLCNRRFAGDNTDTD